MPLQKLQFANGKSPASRKPIKIMHIISDLSIGGAEMMLFKMLMENDRRNFEPVVLTLVDRGVLRERIERLGVVVHTLGMKPGFPSPMGLWRLARLMRRVKPDLILGWMYHSCLAAQTARLFLPHRPPVLWSIHYSIGSLAREKRLTSAVIRMCAFLSKLPAHLIFVSQASQSQHRPLGYCLDKSSVIPNGINEAEFIPSSDARSSVRAELGLADDALLIGITGRYHPMKDHANFLKAAELISRSNPEIHFLLVGPGVEQENEELLRQIRALGLERQTHLLGERNDLPRLQAALDIFSLASAYGESFPNVIGEALACEVCSVVTDVGDAEWIVGKTGRVVAPRDPSALAEAWKELVNIGPEGRMALGRAARTRVVKHFTLKSVVARYAALYETVLASEAPEKFAPPIPATSPRIPNLSASVEDAGAR